MSLGGSLRRKSEDDLGGFGFSVQEVQELGTTVYGVGLKI